MSVSVVNMRMDVNICASIEEVDMNARAIQDIVFCRTNVGVLEKVIIVPQGVRMEELVAIYGESPLFLVHFVVIC